MYRRLVLITTVALVLAGGGPEHLRLAAGRATGSSGHTAGLHLAYEDQDTAESLMNDYIIWSSVVNSLNKWRSRRAANGHRVSPIGPAAGGSNGSPRRLLRRTTHHRTRRDEEVVCYRDVGCFRDEGPFDYLVSAIDCVRAVRPLELVDDGIGM